MKKDYSIKWQAFEYKYKKKSADWLWVLWIMALTITVISIFYNNIMFAILVILSAFTLSIYSVKKPRLINFKISQRGVLINQHLHPYSIIESFWIKDDSEEEPKIILKLKRVLMPYIIIPIQNENPENIEEYLLKYLKKEVHEEPLLTQIMERFGF